MDGAKGNRFSYVTADPFLVINSKGEDVTLTYRGKIIEHKGNPWEFLEQILKDYKIPRIEGLPPFQGGALGYWGYDLARHLEKLPSNAEEDLDIPEMYLGIYDWVLACDNEKQKLTLISTGLPERNADYAKERAENVIGRLNKLDEDQTSLEQKHCVNFVSNFTLAEYTKAIRRVKEYLVSGDSYQVNLSQRFQSEYDGDTWDLYLKLREKNPSPFGAYIDFPEVKILSCSPEEFVNLYDRKVRVRPIKGTRPVGDNAKEIHSNTQQLLSSDKERAENLMIVDLIRNDLGKICKIGSIRVPNLFDVERHPSVLHLVSTVEGDLLESASPVDLLKACFPCGSVTGAPKLRSMEIIGVGVNICEDIWYEYGPTNIQKSNGAELIVNINASPYHAGKRTFRENMIRDRALKNEVFVSYTNLVGGQDELVFDGSSLVVGPNGDLLARGKQFQEDLVITDIYLGTPENVGPSTTNLDDNNIGIPKIIPIPSQINTEPKNNNASEIFEPLDNLSEIYSALVLGTRDYVRKCGFEKVVIGLSGGIDSSLTAAIAVDALGNDNVVGITMPSRYSSDGSVVDAECLARNLGIEIMNVSIEETFTSMLNMLVIPFKNKEPNVAEENLQTRIRGNILMGVSNKFGWMVLTTGNKSEMASGYATLYGDMAGGFAVIKDVPKTLVYDLCKHINLSNSQKNIIPKSVIEKAPSAELKHDQTDQDVLPPYEVLDPIIQAYVEEDMSYKNIVDLGFDAETVKTVIAMINRNEYKRRQAPPGVKITPRAFGRDRRFPIVNKYKDY